MSMIHVHRDGENLTVSKDGCTIVITELRIKPMSNWKTPHQILGRGGCCIALTDHELVQLCSEYLRYTTSEAIEFVSASVDFKLSLTRRKQ
jgi:hypothetical protein